MTDPLMSLSLSTLVPGRAIGRPLQLRAPLSFWGGYDVASGTVIDQTHPDHGMTLANCVLLMRQAKGSSSSSSVLAEAIRAGTAPGAIIMCERDLIVALGALVAAELYGVQMPVVVADEASWVRLSMLAGNTEMAVHAAEDSAIVSFALTRFPRS